MNIAVILAAGDSKRFGGTVHKQYLKLNGKEVIYYPLTELRRARSIDKIIAVVNRDEYEEGYISGKYSLETLPGGETRNHSIGNAIEYIEKHYPNCENVVFHDSVRPFFPAEKFDKYMDLLKDCDAVVTKSAITDTLAAADFTFRDREQFLLIQAPEAFKFELLKSRFNPDAPHGAIVNQLAPGARIYPFGESIFNFKITYPQDLFLAEQFMRIKFFRPTERFDSKSYEKLGKVLLLGGSGGIGGAAADALSRHGVEFLAPTHKELDLAEITTSSLRAALGEFVPDVIINCAAAYAGDDAGLTETFDRIFAVNLKSNLVLLEYAKTLGKKLKMVVLSSSSSTKGRENLTNYSAAKAALNSVVESQADPLSKAGIYLNAVIPEKVSTPLIEKLHKTSINRRELLDADEVLDAIFGLAASEEYGRLLHVRKGL